MPDAHSLEFVFGDTVHRSGVWVAPTEYTIPSIHLREHNSHAALWQLIKHTLQCTAGSFRRNVPYPLLDVYHLGSTYVALSRTPACTSNKALVAPNARYARHRELALPYRTLNETGFIPVFRARAAADRPYRGTFRVLFSVNLRPRRSPDNNKALYFYMPIMWFDRIILDCRMP